MFFWRRFALFRKKDVLTVSSCQTRLYPKLHALDFLQPEKKVIRNKERTDFEIFWQLNITRARGLGHFSSEFSYTLSVATHKSREPKRKDEIRKKKRPTGRSHERRVNNFGGGFRALLWTFGKRKKGRRHATESYNTHVVLYHTSSVPQHPLGLASAVPAD